MGSKEIKTLSYVYTSKEAFPKFYERKVKREEEDSGKVTPEDVSM